MPRSSATITLILPGLSSEFAHGIGRLPSLERLIARGDGLQRIEREARSALYPWQQDLLKTCSARAEDFPSAPTSWRGLNGASAAGTWFHLDPVHLLVSIDGLSLQTIAPWSAAELQQLESVLRPHCEQAGFAWHETANRVFLRCADNLESHTVPPSIASRHELRTMQPQGDARRVIKLGAELQMLLHEHPVQAQRVARGQPPINALWLWGAGELRAQQARTLPMAWSNEPYVRGVYRAYSAECQEAPQSLDTIAQQCSRRHTVHDTLIVAGVSDARQAEQYWFAPLLRALRASVWNRAAVYVDDWRLVVNRRQLRRFWRRPRAVAQSFAGSFAGSSGRSFT